MAIRVMDTPELLSLNKFNVDEKEPHIRLDKSKCRSCQDRPCLVVCPAGLYRLDQEGEINFDHAGCLECGTCRVMCNNKGIQSWNYPRATFGVHYRLG